MDRLGVLVLKDKSNLGKLIETIRKYSLLPGDILIAVTAKHFGIDTVLMFDEDFK